VRTQFTCRATIVCGRVVPVGTVCKVSGCELVGFGSHCSKYPVPYFTAAAALGLTRSDVDVFIKKLFKIYVETMKYNSLPPEVGSGAGTLSDADLGIDGTSTFPSEDSLEDSGSTS
jgi:O-phospho-L-seryl-tRNASec:L-selenocysteinyl-tRNA synthase